MKLAATCAATRRVEPLLAVSKKRASRSRLSFVIVWLVAIFSLTTLAHAQSPDASVTGQVIDSSKAIIVGAHVSAVNVSTNIRQEAVTNGAGAYYFPSLLPGTYRMEAEMTGFLAPKVPRYKMPKRFFFWEALPKSGYGKVPKRLVRDELEARGLLDISTDKTG